MGNWVNKEWSQIDAFSGDEENPLDESKKQKLKSLKKKSSLTVSNQHNLPNKDNIIDIATTPNPKQLIAKIAELDPRSPSSEIIRTPICLIEKQQTSNVSKQPAFDPRSPTNEYNRTPIHVNFNTESNQNETNSLNTSLNLSITSFSLDSSSMVVSDSSLLLQQVPETLACISNTGNLVANSSNHNDTPSKIQKIIGSNLPRHILQRKQVAKLNKKKLIENNEKENSN